MPDLSADEIVRNQHVRLFYQPGGAAPQNPAYLTGSTEAAPAFLTGGSIPNNGSIDPIWMPGRFPGTYRLVGRQRGTPGLPTADLVFHPYHTGLPRALTRQRCQQDFYSVHGRCADLSDLNRGWEGYALIYAGGIAGDADIGAQNARDADAPLATSIPYTFADIYPVGQLFFGDEASADVVSEVIDGVVAPVATCGECGPENDGSAWAYFVTRSNVGSPSAPGQIVYTLTGGLSWATAAITGIGTTNAPTGIDLVGNRLVVLVSGATEWRYATLSATGVPGTFTALSVGHAPVDIWVRSRVDIYTVGSTGIWRTRDLTVAPTQIDSTANLLRIHGTGATVVAVGNGGMIRVSQNSGVTWTTVALNIGSGAITDNVTAVYVKSSREFWVGTVAGKVYATVNGGASWTLVLVGVPTDGSPAIRDIAFATNAVGYVAFDAGSPVTSGLAATIDGGNSWATDGARVQSYPIFEKANRVVLPQTGIADVDANVVYLPGLRATAGGDGVVVQGYAARSA